MALKQELLIALERERAICNLAINRLSDECGQLEKKYKMLTEEFLDKFNKGLLGDEEEYFEWYAIAKGRQAWTKTREALNEMLQ